MAVRQFPSESILLGSRASVFFAALVLAMLVWPSDSSAIEEPSNRFSIAALENSFSEQFWAIQSFELTGVVFAVVQERKLVGLQDNQGAVFLELPALNQVVQPGDCLVVKAENCLVQKGPYAIRIGGELMLNNDGIHGAITRSGNTFLAKGMQPIQLEWFNSGVPFALNVEYEGPAISRQQIPCSNLWHSAQEAGSAEAFQPGLKFAAYNCERLTYLPDFEQLSPIAEGIATNFTLDYRVRNNDTALRFNGFIEIEKAGLYAFYLQSDDGSRLAVGKPTGCQVTKLEYKVSPKVGSLEQAPFERADPQWVELEGVVTFVGTDQTGLQLEIAHARNSVQVTVLDGQDLVEMDLLGEHVRLKGLCEFPRESGQSRAVRVFVPASQYVQLEDASTGTGAAESADIPLRVISEIRALKPDQASKSREAIVKGVVTWRSPVALVLQDNSGGIFIHYNPTNESKQVSVGDLLEIHGWTDRGDWSPVIVAREATFFGHAPMPEPLHPTWDQLMNGSLDAQYVEVRGVLTSIANDELALLTAAGKIKIIGGVDRPLPAVRGPGIDDCSDSVVRIRGCLTPQIDWSAMQLKPGEVFISPAIVSVEEARPSTPFSVPTRKASELQLFDPSASALQRIKVAGQIIYVRSAIRGSQSKVKGRVEPSEAAQGEYIAIDGKTGYRILTAHPVLLQPGDLVEVVGFPKPGGASPTLQEARIQKMGSAPLPTPVTLRSEELLDRKHDSTLVQVEGVLVSDTIQQGERILELQSGPFRFLARLTVVQEGWFALPVGSRLRLMGVHANLRDDRARLPLAGFELLLNDAAAITVIERPPWWTVRRALMIAGAFAAALGVAFAWVTVLRRKVEIRTAELQKEIEERQRVEQRNIVEQERTRVARDLHDELGAGLTEMGLLGSLAKNPAVPKEERERYLDQLTDSARWLVTGLDEIVWAINPQYDTVGSLVTYYSLFAQRFLNLAGIACRLEVTEPFPEYPLDSRIRHGVFLAFKEALNNVVRHSKATEAEVRIQIVESQLTISIRDNGRGVGAPESANGKDGLVGMRERLQQLDGSCRIFGQSGEGTTVEFRLGLKGNGS